MKEKRYFVVCFLLLCALGSRGGCLSEYNRAKRMYQNGKFIEAGQTFQWCLSYCSNDLDQSEVAKYIDLCNKRIETLRKEQVARRQLIQEQQEQSRKQVENNKLIYLSCDARIFGETYPHFTSEISAGLARKGYRFTKDKDKAYWIVTLTAIAREDKENQDYYISFIDVFGSIYNTISEIEIPYFMSESEGSIKPDGSYTDAAKQVLKIYSASCVNEIVEIIRNY